MLGGSGQGTWTVRRSAVSGRRLVDLPGSASVVVRGVLRLVTASRGQQRTSLATRSLAVVGAGLLVAAVMGNVSSAATQRCGWP